MGYKDASSKERFVILTNAGLRAAQFAVAVVTIGIYAVIRANWISDVPAKLAFDIAVGVMALFTALAFGAIPFVMSYRPVAFGAVWDLIMAVLYAIAFGLMRGMNHPSTKDGWGNYAVSVGDDSEQIRRDIETFKRDSYVLVVGTILFLASAVMGAVLICLGRRSARDGFKV